jgi:hypothetical protein
MSRASTTQNHWLWAEPIQASNAQTEWILDPHVTHTERPVRLARTRWRHRVAIDHRVVPTVTLTRSGPHSGCAECTDHGGHGAGPAWQPSLTLLPASGFLFINGEMLGGQTKKRKRLSSQPQTLDGPPTQTTSPILPGTLRFPACCSCILLYALGFFAILLFFFGGGGGGVGGGGRGINTWEFCPYGGGFGRFWGGINDWGVVLRE